MRSLNKSEIIRFGVDCVITVVLLCVALNFFKIFKRRGKRGFFCNDESLKYPYLDDSLVGHNGLLFICLYMPSMVIVLFEVVLYLLKRTRTNSVRDNGKSGIYLAVWNLHYNLTPFLCGIALHALFVDLIKISFGRLRPHFFVVCQPYRREDGSTCDNPKNHGIYIHDYECNGKSDPLISPRMIEDVYKSFPSGHASFMFYSIIFIVFYLHRVTKTLRQYGINVGLSVMVIQMLCVLLAWFIAVSRVMDYKHHWSDVLVGIVLGTLGAIAVTWFVCQQLRSVNSCWPAGVKLSSSNSETTSTTTSAATLPNDILVP